MKTTIAGASTRRSRSRRVKRPACCSRAPLTGTGFAPLNARQNILEAKQNALIRARKEMIRAIRAEDDRVQNNAIIPIDVQEIVTGGQGDELVKVP